ncbi:MAG: hypothetical protein IPO98_06925 [Saprospiraceae bacterium]|nr:hypothetical protein [Saprospiraceae bacterium]
MGIRNSLNVKCFNSIYSYSKIGIKSFNLLGAENVFWCPLAGDNDIHQLNPKKSEDFKYDISFIGNHRPEREEVLVYLINEFPELRIKINGSWRIQNLNYY